MHYFNWENTYFEGLSVIGKKNFLQKIRIIRYLYVHGPKTNAEICSHLKISAPKSVAVLNELISDDLIEKQGRGESIGGRKPDLYGIKNNSLYVLSIDMDKYRSNMSVFDSNNNNITGIHTLSVPLDNDAGTLDKISAYAEELISVSGIDASRLIGIGISMPGLVDAQQGVNFTYLNVGPSPIREILQKRFNRPVFIENDARAAALAEYRFGLARGKKDVLTVTVDWGIGLGLILNGKLFRGTSGFAGEFSHIPMAEDGLLCHCGKHGCLETVASGTTIAFLAREGIKQGKSTLLKSLSENDPDRIDIKMVVDAALQGDQFAIGILSEVGYNLGKGLAILIQLFNPELIILGGRVSEAGQYITTSIQQSLNTYSMHQIQEKTQLVLSQLGESVGTLGAVATVMENIFVEYLKQAPK